MVESDAASTDSMYHYSLKYDWSLGVRYMALTPSDESYVIGQSNWLLKRWNKPESQGNLYFLSGVGIPSQTENANPLFHIGTQADWETRRLYTLFRAEYYSTETARASLRGRIGIAPYKGGFDDIHTWLIAQVEDVIIGDQHSLSVIPVVRVFRDNILVEVGSNFSGKSIVAAMIHM